MPGFPVLYHLHMLIFKWAKISYIDIVTNASFSKIGKHLNLNQETTLLFLTQIVQSQTDQPNSLGVNFQHIKDYVRMTLKI